jgi:hypothetical protein
MHLDEILQYVVVIIAIITAIYVVKRFSRNPHKTLIRFVAANIILDVVAIAIYGLFPATQWTIYQLDFYIVGIEAALAAVMFSLTLFGLIKTKKWAPILAIGLTVTQRAFATYVFFPSIGISLTLIWSLLIIYFAYLNLKRPVNYEKGTTKPKPPNMTKQ